MNALLKIRFFLICKRYFVFDYHINDDLDDALEYEENDIAEHFKQFYDDVRAEMGKYGRLLQLLVCSNYQPHLRGNVYVQYER